MEPQKKCRPEPRPKSRQRRNHPNRRPQTAHPPGFPCALLPYSARSSAKVRPNSPSTKRGRETSSSASKPAPRPNEEPQWVFNTPRVRACKKKRSCFFAAYNGSPSQPEGYGLATKKKRAAFLQPTKKEHIQETNKNRKGVERVDGRMGGWLSSLPG